MQYVEEETCELQVYQIPEDKSLYSSTEIIHREEENFELQYRTPYAMEHEKYDIVSATSPQALGTAKPR